MPNPMARAADPPPADAVPSPESVLGRPFGSKAVRYDELVRYLERLAAASPRVTMTEYARSHEGRPLYYLTITGAANHARLARIKDDNARLADPRRLGDNAAAEAERIIDELPAIAWLAYSIHGDELASTDAAMHLAYELAAGGRSSQGLEGRATQQPDTQQPDSHHPPDWPGDQVDRLLDEIVVLIDPLMNPDGRERYLGQLEQLQGVTPNPDYQSVQHGGLWSAGRGNHYLFDMNRDWLMVTQPETRGRVAAIGSWHPHLLVDSHEMGGLDTYLFDPPREPINPLLPPQTLAWRRRFGADQAKVFDARGWSYYTQEWYEEWYPGYTNAWASLNGGIGLLYEAAGVDSTLVRQPAGHTLTYPETVEQHLVSSLANLETLRANRSAILRDFFEFHQRAIADAPDNQGAFVAAGDAEPAALRRLREVLDVHGVEYTIARSMVELARPESWDGHRWDTIVAPAGSLVIPERQPRGLWLHAMLDFDPRMTDAFVREERERTENDQDTMLYDVTAWNLGMAFNVPLYWVDAVPRFDGPTASDAPRPDAAILPSNYGYLLDGADEDVMTVLGRLLADGLKPRVALDPFGLGGRSYRPGSILLRRSENPGDGHERLERAVRGTHVDALAVETGLSDYGPDLGGGRFVLLHEPRVAIATQWPVSTTSFGAVWHLLDLRVGVRTSPVNVQHLAGIDLRTYNVLILPDASPDGLAAVLGDGGVSHLKDWIHGGGTLIAMSGAAAFVADASRGLSEVRLKRDALEELEQYAESVARERSARSVTIDPADVWLRRNAPPSEPQASPDESPIPPDKAPVPPDDAPVPPEAAPVPPGHTSAAPPSARPSASEPRASARAESPAPTDAQSATPPTSAPNVPMPPTGPAEAPSQSRKTAANDDEPAQPQADHMAKPWPDDLDERKRLDEWQRRFSPSGVFLAGELNVKHWLTFGIHRGDEAILPVLVSGDVALMSRYPVATPVRLAPADGLRLAGLLWPEARRRWADTAWATVERVGRGQIILFAGEPAFRGYMEGAARLLMNAVLLGPGAGTDQPVPW